MVGVVGVGVGVYICIRVGEDGGGRLFGFFFFCLWR